MNSTQNVSHIDLTYVIKSFIYLNTATLSNLNLLTLSLTLPLVCKLNYIQNLTFHILINSRSMHYFINTIFALKYNIFIKLTLYIKLKLFNRLLNCFLIYYIFIQKPNDFKYICYSA